MGREARSIGSLGPPPHGPGSPPGTEIGKGDRRLGGGIGDISDIQLQYRITTVGTVRSL
jgi:hypothetical protein